MILLWGLPKESAMAAVARALQASGANVCWASQLEYDHLSAELRVENGAVIGWIDNSHQRIDLASVTGAYLRPYATPQSASCTELAHAAALDQLILTWAELAEPAVAVINRPCAMASNDSKPAQTELIRTYGFEVPDTIVTTEAASVEEFWNLHRTVIYKSTSGIRSIVSALTDDHRSRFQHLTTCPTQLQAFIPGEDYRVHTVGDEVFATRISCDATDYRYAGRHGVARTMDPIQLPPVVQARCLALARGLGLLVAGIDLRLTPEEQWYCFEVNTSPAFSWFQEHTNQRIAEAIANLLISGR